jgi:hypothetical protein
MVIVNLRQRKKAGPIDPAFPVSRVHYFFLVPALRALQVLQALQVLRVFQVLPSLVLAQALQVLQLLPFLPSPLED